MKEREAGTEGGRKAWINEGRRGEDKGQKGKEKDLEGTGKKRKERKKDRKEVGTGVDALGGPYLLLCRG